MVKTHGSIYQNDGIDFLSLMYETLTTTDWLKTTTPTEYIEKYGPQIEKLDLSLIHI